MSIKGASQDSDRRTHCASLAFLGGLGDLGLVFRDLNPLAAISLFAAAARGVPLVQSFIAAFSTLALGDAAAWLGAAATRSLKAANWLENKDPLVIDLDGDGIEIIGLSDSRAYFDSDGDLFRERTGWLKGDDGFLVLDSNGNGRIDDISELFGNRAQGGYAELAGYDSNGDGRISVGDLIWSELKVWQDYDRDGVTDAGELKSLDALGIVVLNLTHDVIDVTTPQGAQLLARGDVTFAEGRVTRSRRSAEASNDNEIMHGTQRNSFLMAC